MDAAAEEVFVTSARSARTGYQKGPTVINHWHDDTSWKFVGSSPGASKGNRLERALKTSGLLGLYYKASLPLFAQ